MPRARSPQPTANSQRPPKGRSVAEARYGTLRSFGLRTLYTWLTLTMLFAFPWPLLVILTSAPGVGPQDTPFDWYQPRLLAPLLTAVAAGWLWWKSAVPVEVGLPERALALFRRGRVWPQVLVFLLALPVVLTLVLLVEDPAGALKISLLALAEAAVIQILIAGYLAGTFELLLPERGATFPTLALFMLTFTMRALLAAAAEETLPQEELVTAMLAGLAGGALIGAVSLWLRKRSGSLLPGILGLWLVFLLLGLPGVYE